jgi:hypothetical protein
VGGVQLGQQVELLALGRTGEAEVARMFFDQLFYGALGGVDVVALVDPGEEAALPVLRLLDREAAGAERHEAGQVLVLGAEAVGHPGAHRRTHLTGFAAVHQQQRRLVVRARRPSSNG